MAFNLTKVSIGDTTKKSHHDQLIDNDSHIMSADADFHGEKTFHSSTVFRMTSTFEIRPKLDGIKSRTSTSGVDIEITKILQSSTATVVAMAHKIIEIGDWNMATSTTFDLAHGLADQFKIRKLTLMIRADTGSAQEDALYKDGYTATGTEVDLKINVLDATNLRLWHRSGGFFDGVSFDALSFNRGWVFVEYEI